MLLSCAWPCQIPCRMFASIARRRELHCQCANVAENLLLLSGQVHRLKNQVRDCLPLLLELVEWFWDKNLCRNDLRASFHRGKFDRQEAQLGQQCDLQHSRHGESLLVRFRHLCTVASCSDCSLHQIYLSCTSGEL